MIRNPRYGWRRQLPDPRDLHWRLPRVFPPAVPVDLRPEMPPIVDQGQLGSCTANAGAGAMGYEAGRQGLSMAAVSRLFIYFNERMDDGTIDSDAGSTIRECMKAINTYGAPPESVWPYDIGQFTVQPMAAAYADGKLDVALKYEAVDQSLALIRSVLQAKLAIEFGFLVFDGYENVGSDGMVPMPGLDEQPLGGHANLLIGDQPNISRFIVRNSWGTAWGDEGYAYLPYDYLLNSQLASDFWAVQLVGKD